MSFGEPSVQGGVILIVDQRVAENPVLDPAAQRLDYHRRGLEIHIGHPEGDYIPRSGLAVPLV